MCAHLARVQHRGARHPYESNADLCRVLVVCTRPRKHEQALLRARVIFCISTVRALHTPSLYSGRKDYHFEDTRL